MKTIVRLRIHTFPPGQTSGSCIHVADVKAEIEFQNQQVSNFGGCFNSELVTREVPIVNLEGRRFIVTKEHFDNSVDYSVGVPQDLAATIKSAICPCCKSLIPCALVTRETVAKNAIRVYSFRDRSYYVCDGKAYYSFDSLRRTLLDNQARTFYIEEADEYTTARFLITEIERGAIKFADKP